MKLTNKYLLLIAASLSGLTACNTESDVGDAGKTPIAFVSGIQQIGTSTASRAVTGGGQIGFQTGSKMLLRASNNWKSTANVVTVTGVAQAGTGTPITNPITVPLYWDDFGAGDLTNSDVASTGITVYGIAVDDGGTNSSTPTAVSDWTNIPVDFSGNQSGWNTAPNSKDYVISHNVTGLKYVKGSEPTAELAFSHPFSKVTLNLKYGAGFTTSPTTGITLKGFNTVGSLNVTTGECTTTATTDVTTLRKQTTALSGYYTYDALVLPGRNFTTAGEAIALNIDGNIYSINTSDFVSQIDADYQTMKAGANYIFNITVNKTEIKVSAYVTDWTGVEITAEPSNGTEATFATSTNGLTSNFDLYKSGFNSATTASAATSGFSLSSKYVYDSGSTSKYKLADGYSATYWPNNSTYYHFRGLVPAETTVTKDATNGDYVEMTSKADPYAPDIMWSAPYITTSNVTSISPALGPTKSVIGLEFKHMMAQVVIQLLTTTGDDKVTLTTDANTKVELTCASSGRMRLGDGTVNALGASATYTPTYNSGTFTYNTSSTVTGYYLVGVVPQPTSSCSLKITTSDGNVYPISDLSTLTSGGKAVTSWEAGKQYIYKLTLKKTGIVFSVTLVDWSAITGDTQTVVIK